MSGSRRPKMEAAKEDALVPSCGDTPEVRLCPAGPCFCWWPLVTVAFGWGCGDVFATKHLCFQPNILPLTEMNEIGYLV